MYTNLQFQNTSKTTLYNTSVLFYQTARGQHFTHISYIITSIFLCIKSRPVHSVSCAQLMSQMLWLLNLWITNNPTHIFWVHLAKRNTPNVGKNRWKSWRVKAFTILRQMLLYWPFAKTNVDQLFSGATITEKKSVMLHLEIFRDLAKQFHKSSCFKSSINLQWTKGGERRTEVERFGNCLQAISEQVDHIFVNFNQSFLEPWFAYSTCSTKF